MIWAVIMAGGSGERFWPKSRKSSPKQLLPITGVDTMIQMTVKRLEGVVPPERVLVITNSDQAVEMKKQLPQIPEENIVAEPMGRDTAPAVGASHIFLQHKDPEAVSIVLPADHVIHDKESFCDTLMKCANMANEGALITLGIEPTFPATGYGYLRVNDEPYGDDGFFKVEQFVEKPNLERAEQFLKDGNYLWNSGMFVWKAETVLEEIQIQMPGLWQGLLTIKNNLEEGQALEDSFKDVYSSLEKKSIDYGIMENARQVLGCRVNFDWDDVGSWESVGKHFKADENGNVIIGEAQLINCHNLIVYNLSQSKLIATAIDLKDQVLVQTDDAVLVFPLGSGQKIKELLNCIREKEDLTKYLY